MSEKTKREALMRKRAKNAKITAISKIKRANHRETVLERQRRSSSRRRAKLKSNGYSIYTLEEVLSKYGLNCHICKNQIDFDAPRGPTHGNNWELGLQIDHLIPISKGGPDTLDNVRPSHAQCNIKKRAN